MIPYGKQSIDESDIQAVSEVLKSDFLTTGPKVEEFERAVAAFTGANFAVAVSNGTAALHAAMFALDIGPGDEVIVPPMTFAASSNCVLYQGGTPVFADVRPDTLLLDPAEVAKKITPRTKAIIAVDYTGQPCDYDALRAIASKHNLALVADAAHSIGAEYKEQKVGTLADLTTFSFHPVKHITTGEGGMVMTDNQKLYERVRMFRQHGIDSDHKQRQEKGGWYYEMTFLGYNYRITDFQCALGLNQLKKLPDWLDIRRKIAEKYDHAFEDIENIEPLTCLPHVKHAYHLYVVKIHKHDRDAIFTKLRENRVGANVHYIPVHLHPYYREHLGTGTGLCPVAEQSYEQIISLPIHPSIQAKDIEHVIKTVIAAVA